MLRLVTFACPGETRLGAVVGDHVVDLSRVDPSIPVGLSELIAAGPTALELARAAVEQVMAEFRGDRAALVRDGKLCALSDVLLLAPIPRPARNVFCVGRNYMKHIEESARAMGVAAKANEYPEFFTKPPSAVVGPGGVFPLDDSATEKLDYEAELAVVIGRRGRNIEPARAYDYVFGYTLGNDLSARDAQRQHGQWFKGKAFDGSCPLGPAVVPHADIGDPHALSIQLRVNGELRQSANTSEMMWKIPDILFWLSRGLTLEPGDIVLTGTPEGVGSRMTPPVYLQPGDVVEAELEAVGTLQTRIVRA